MSSGRLAPLPFRRATTLGRCGLERKRLNGDALRFENLLQVLGGGDLGARGIARVEAQERLEVPHRFFLDARPLWRRGRLGREHGGAEGENQEEQSAHDGGS